MHDEVTPPNAEAGTETLRDKVEAAKSRLAERTANAKPVQTVKGLIEEHPVASVAAGILLGALVAKALPSLSRRNNQADEAVNSLRKSAAGIASVAGKLALDYATRARDAGREGLHKVEDIGSSAGSRLSDGSEDAKRKVIDIAEIARSAAIEASEAALRKVNELTSRIRH